MKLYLFPYVECVSDRYHSEGGLVVVANDKGHAARLIEAFPTTDKEAKAVGYSTYSPWERSEENPPAVTAEEWEQVVVYDLAGKPEPAVYIFPDAGCC